MKITIEIPEEFEHHFETDKFKDSLQRLKVDAGTFCMASRYEIELCDMLIDAFSKAQKPRTVVICDICGHCNCVDD